MWEAKGGLHPFRGEAGVIGSHLGKMLMVVGWIHPWASSFCVLCVQLTSVLLWGDIQFYCGVTMSFTLQKGCNTGWTRWPTGLLLFCLTIHKILAKWVCTFFYLLDFLATPYTSRKKKALSFWMDGLTAFPLLTLNHTERNCGTLHRSKPDLISPYWRVPMIWELELVLLTVVKETEAWLWISYQ